MTITYYNAPIDRTGKHVMTPEALAAYLLNRVCAEVDDIPDFIPTDRFTLTVSDYARVVRVPFNYAKIEYNEMTLYYFVDLAEPSDPYGGQVNATFSIDFPHTLRIGDSEQQFYAVSRLTRSHGITNREGFYETNRARLAKVEELENYRGGWTAVLVFTTAGEAANQHAYQAVVATVATADDTFQLAMTVANRLLKCTTFTASSGEEEIAILPVVLYMIPATYLYAEPNGAKLKLENGAEFLVNDEPMQGATHSHYLPGTVNQAMQTREIGSFNHRITVPAQVGVKMQIRTRLDSRTANFSCILSCEGQSVDLTSDCIVPYLMANLTEVQKALFQKYAAVGVSGASAAASAVGLAASLYTGNAAGALGSIGGLISGASGVASALSGGAAASLPTLQRDGNFYSGQIGCGYADGDLVDAYGFNMFTYDNTPDVQERNIRQGPEGSKQVTSLDFLRTTYTYIKGDMHLKSASSSPVTDDYILKRRDEVHRIFEEGVTVWASQYMEV